MCIVLQACIILCSVIVCVYPMERERERLQGWQCNGSSNKLSIARWLYQSKVKPDLSLSLLVIRCTLRITNCEAERSFSSLQLSMNHLRSSMGEER